MYLPRIKSSKLEGSFKNIFICSNYFFLPCGDLMSILVLMLAHLFSLPTLHWSLPVLELLKGKGSGDSPLDLVVVFLLDEMVRFFSVC